MGLFRKSETIQRIDLQGERIENLSKWLKEVTKSIDNLKKRDEIKSLKIDKLESSYDDLEKKLEQSKQENETLSERNLVLNHELDSYIDELNKINEKYLDLVKTIVKSNKDLTECLTDTNDCLIYDNDLEESKQYEENLRLEDEAE